MLTLLTQFLLRPSQSIHLVLVCRQDPALPIFALRAKGQVTEMRTQDLRFTKSEIAKYLEQYTGIQIDPSIAHEVEKAETMGIFKR